MNARAPQTLVRINIPHAAKNALVEQQRLDSRAAASKMAAKFRFAGFERIKTEPTKNIAAARLRNQSHPTEAPRVGVAKFAIVIQREPYMRVQRGRHCAGTDRKLPCHAEMNNQVKSFGLGVDGGLRRGALFEEKYEEFAAALNVNDATTWGVLFDYSGIVDEIRLAQANAEYAAAREQQLQAADDSFDFGKFGQVSIRQNGENAHRAAGTAFEFYGRGDNECAGCRQLIQVRDVFDVKQARG